MAKNHALSSKLVVPSAFNWRTTDTDELNRRRLRAQEESFAISNRDPRHPIFSNFSVNSGSGLTYEVEIRDVRARQFSCECVDFRINGLGTCKHVEAVLLYLQARLRRLFKAASEEPSPRLDLVPDVAADRLRLNNGSHPLPKELKRWFAPDGKMDVDAPEAALEALEELRQTRLPQVRISIDVRPWLERRARAAERKELRREYELESPKRRMARPRDDRAAFPLSTRRDAAPGVYRAGATGRRNGFRQNDSSHCGLRAIASARQSATGIGGDAGFVEDRVGRSNPALYSPALSTRVRARHRRLEAYSQPPFFTIVNYEQMLLDALEVNARLQPDVVVLDEAQRIKNWDTKTAQAIKRLKSRYAFVLTGTPIENRIDEIHSLMDFLEPAVLGPLFRFNRDFYELDERGRPEGYRNLDQLHARIHPYMLRRRKAEVETELPDRTDRNHFVQLSGEQETRYADHSMKVSRLMHAAQHRPLTQLEQEKLQRELAMCRMICDTNYILDPEERACPKLAELEKILEECRENSEVKVIVFSEWERMLELVRELCQKLSLGYAWHTGSVPQLRRRAEINTFKNDPNCRVFLSTDSGSTGLNLQIASVVVNCDLPWNPARLEQRIARAWRKHQTRAVTVINLVTENTIEHRMLDTLATKQALAEGVLDLKGDLKEIKLRGGRQAFLARLQQLISPTPAQSAKAEAPKTKPLPADRALAFTQLTQEKINGALVRCEERYPTDGPHSVLLVVVDQDAPNWRDRLSSVHEELFGPGKSDPLAPTRLEVIDRATDEALQRLIEAGVIARTSRATRALFPAAAENAGPPPLSEEEKARAAAHRQQAARRLKMAGLLAQGDLLEEGRAALLESIHHFGRALAVENRMPEPSSLQDVLLPPLSMNWGDRVSMLRQFVNEPAAPWQSALEALGKM